MGDLEVVLVPHMAWVASQGPMAWVMALLTALLMVSQTMALVPMASIKAMASSHLLMASNLLQLPTPLRSNLLDISHPNSLLTLSNLPTHSPLPMVNNLPIPSSL